MKKISEEIREFREWAIRILIGDGWVVTTPIGNDQINEVAMEEIIFPKCGMGAKDRKEKKKEILNDDERKQLRQVVKDLIDYKAKVRWVKKVKNLYKPTEHKEHILIYYAEPADTWFIDWTDFEEGTRYKGMELDRDYTPEELGL